MPTASEDRPRQLPWIAAGLAITLTTAIIFAIWASSLSGRIAVAVASRAIPAGSRIQAADLRAVEMAVGQGAAYVPIADVDSLLGHVVRTGVAEGAILHPGLVSVRSAVGDDQAVAGMVLDPGEYPVADLSSGQTVGVVITSETGVANGNHPSEGQVVQAQVVEASELPDSNRGELFVSLLASRAGAERISRAASNNKLRLLLLPQLAPLTPSSPDTLPGSQQAGIDQPGSQQAGIDQPGSQQAGIDQPGSQQPGIDQPGSQQPDMAKDRP